MPVESIQVRTLRAAADMLYGVAGVAAYLNVTPDVVRAWLSGSLAMREGHFLKLVDVVAGDLSKSERHAVAAARHVGQTYMEEPAADDGGSVLPEDSRPLPRG